MLSWVRQPEQPAVGSVGGLRFGSAVWLIADEIGVPLDGLPHLPSSERSRITPDLWSDR